MVSRKCFFRCLLNSHPPIPLPHASEVKIGRMKDTGIKDPQCSRNQVSLKANCEDCTVEVRQVGVNASGLDGFTMLRQALYTVKHGTQIEVLINKFIHVIEFEPPPEDAHKLGFGVKRKMEETDNESKKEKLPKLESEGIIGDSVQLDIKTYEEDVWDNVDNGELYIFSKKGVKASKKIAAFDMDGTLIMTKSGKVHPVDTNDWKIANGTVPKKLKEQYEKGFKIVIFTNQSPIGKGRVKIDDFKKKMEGIVEKIGVPIQAFIATGKGIYRKPVTGMWDYLTKNKNDKIPVDMTESFYVGDAAGRVANWAPGRKKDHSLADKLFAENLGLSFYTPEQYFFGHSVKNIQMIRPDFEPKALDLDQKFDDKLISDCKELLVLVGYPGSGKSFVAKEITKRSNGRYSIVCRDEMGTWQKCATEAAKLLKQGKSVVVDSTNPDVESRSRWIAVAREQDAQCRCAYMDVSFAHAQHNNKFRELTKAKHMPVPDMVFYTFKNKYKQPKTEEGFKDVVKVKFTPMFGTDDLKKLYTMHLMEK